MQKVLMMFFWAAVAIVAIASFIWNNSEHKIYEPEPAQNSIFEEEDSPYI